MAFAVVWTFGLPAVAQERAATLDDVLAMETFGGASISPDGRWVVYERQEAYDSAPRFDRSVRSGWATTRLLIASVGGGDPEPLIADPGQWGFLLGPWSPESGRLLIYRWRDETFEAGWVDLSDRSVHWTALTPDLPITGLAAAWLDEDRLVLTLRPDRSLPWKLRFDTIGQERLLSRWSATASGERPSRLAVETRDGAVMAEVETPSRRVVLLSLATGALQNLSEGLVRDIAPSPDGRWLAVVTAAEATTTLPEERAVQSATLRRSRLSLVDLDNSLSIAPQIQLDVAPHLLRWSENSSKVLVWARRDDQLWRDGDLTSFGVDGVIETFDRAGMGPSAPGRTIDELNTVHADWLDGQPIIYARPEGQSRFDWWRLRQGAPISLTEGLRRPPALLSSIQPTALSVFADGALWSVSADGRLTRLSRANAVVTNAESNNPMQTLRLRLNGTPRRSWSLVAAAQSLTVLDTASRPVWTSDEAWCEGLAVTLAASREAALRKCLHGGIETLRLFGLSGGRVLDQVNAEFGTLALARPRLIRHPDRTGAEASSYLYLPVGMRAADVKGLVVHIYPGAASDDGRYVDGLTLHMGPRVQLLAMQGYAVLSAYVPSEKLSAPGEMFNDFAIAVDLAVDAALAAEPDLPADRLALIGHSFGGYAALGVATRTTRFRSVIAWAAPSNLLSRWGELPVRGRLWPEEDVSPAAAIGSVENGQASAGAPPWAALNAYAEASPALMPGRITAPVLLITADRDYVAMSQADSMFSALYRLGKPARLLTYWGEGHENASPANIRDVLEEIAIWLDRSFATSASEGR